MQQPPAMENYESFVRERVRELLHHAYTRATHFSFTIAITDDLPLYQLNNCIKNDACMAYVHVILPETHGNHRDNERIAKVLFMHCSLCS